MKKDIFLGLFFITLSAIAIKESVVLKIGSLGHPGPGFFPMIAAIGIAISCIVIVFQATNRRKTGNEITDTNNTKTSYKVLFLLLVLFMVSFFLDEVGYPITCFISLIIMFRLLERTRWVVVLSLAAILAIGSSFLFNGTLTLELPRGPIPYGFLHIFY